MRRILKVYWHNTISSEELRKRIKMEEVEIVKGGDNWVFLDLSGGENIMIGKWQ